MLPPGLSGRFLGCGSEPCVADKDEDGENGAVDRGGESMKPPAVLSIFSVEAEPQVGGIADGSDESVDVVVTGDGGTTAQQAVQLIG